MEAFLPPDVHFAWIGDDIVSLDVPNDAYLCLVGAAIAVRDRAGGRLEIAEPAVFRVLHEAGLAQADPDPAVRRAAVTPRTALSPFDQVDSSAGLRFLISGLRSSRHYHGRRFADLVDRVRGLPQRRGSTPSRRALKACVSAYRAGLPWIPRQEVCLHRSFMLVHYLAERGVAADWVFGVRTWPFAAHCWVQIDDVIVGDDLHKVVRYTPILVV